MSTFLGKVSILLPIATLLAVILFWQSPVSRFILVLLLLFSMVQAFAGVFAKYRKEYLQKKIKIAVLVRNTLLEIAALALVMILAGWLGRGVAQLATHQISDAFLKLIAGLVIGLLVGIGVGILLNQLWGRFVRLSVLKQASGSK